MSKKECKNLTNRRVVTQPNSLINGRYELDPTQQKIILLAIAQVDSVNDDEFFRYSVTVDEFEKLTGSKINHKQFRQSCRDLFSKPVSIIKPKGWLDLAWFSSIEYFSDEARFEFEISPKMLPYLLKIKEQFTTYNLQQVIQFKGKYTTRFYQFFMQIKNTDHKKKTYELDFLYEILEAPKSLRKFYDFKRYILQPSIDEINEISDIKASFREIKKGKKVVEIELFFDYKKTLKTQTTKARETKNLNKYKGKEFLYFDSILKIIEVKLNVEKNRVEVIYQYNADEIARADFDSIEHLDRAIREAEIQKAEIKKYPEKYSKKERDFAKLF